MEKSFYLSNCLKGLLLFITFLCYGVSAHADHFCDFEVNGICYNFLSTGTNEVAVTYGWYESGRYGGYNSPYSGNVTIPATVTYKGDTYQVTAVDSHTFDESSITSVSLPNTITSIGAYAFADCTALSTIFLPQNVKSIGAGAFDGCVSLISITIPDNVTSIGASAFANCRSLYTISIPNSVTNIGGSAFAGTGWFDNQADGLVYAGKVAYTYKGTMPANTEIRISEGTKGIAGTAFCGCSGLTSIQLPNSVTYIGPNAFDGCLSLSSISIPEKVTRIESFTFYGCSALSSVTIPVSVHSIGSYAFSGTAWYNNQPDGLIYAGNVVYGYKGTMPVNTQITLAEGTKGIAERAFYSYKNLTSIIIPEGTENIGMYAFSGCTGLQTITLPDGITSISACVFEGCSNLESIGIPESVKSIGNAAFFGCAKLSSITIPEGLKAINGSVFYGCSSLTDITIPESVIMIGSSAFERCTNLTSITLPANVMAIYDEAFPSTMESLIVKRTKPAFVSEDAFYNLYASNVSTPTISFIDCTLYVPEGCKELYESTSEWNKFKTIVEMESDISQLDNAIYIEPFTAYVGSDADIEIKVKNANAITSYGFEIVLPDGMSIDTDSDNSFDDAVTLSARHKGHLVTTNKLSENTYKIGVASLSSKTLTGNDGLVLTIRAQVTANMAPGKYPIKIQSPLLVESDGTKPAIQPTMTVVTIEDYIKGDVDGDGVVDLADAVVIINHYVGKPVNKFIEKAADVDGDGVVDLADAVRVINYYVGKVESLSRRPVYDGLEPQ